MTGHPKVTPDELDRRNARLTNRRDVLALIAAALIGVLSALVAAQVTGKNQASQDHTKFVNDSRIAAYNKLFDAYAIWSKDALAAWRYLESHKVLKNGRPVEDKNGMYLLAMPPRTEFEKYVQAVENDFVDVTAKGSSAFSVTSQGVRKAIAAVTSECKDFQDGLGSLEGKLINPSINELTFSEEVFEDIPITATGSTVDPIEELQKAIRAELKILD